MNTVIVHAPIQICNVNPEQHTDLFCKTKQKQTDLYFFFFKDANGLFGIDVTDLNTNSANGCIHCSSRYMV